MICGLAFGLLLFGSIVGMQESFAEEKTWWLGENLKQGDYFEYSLCHMDYDHCEEIRMKIWIEGDTTVGSETNWLAQVVVYEGNKIIKGEMEFGKIAAEPLSSSENLRAYKDIFKNSVSVLSAFASSGEGHMGGPIDFSKNSFQRICDPGCPQLTPMGTEVITIPAGTFNAEVISWGGMSGVANTIWVVDDFPFPVKASVFMFSQLDDAEKKYEYELLYYKENVSFAQLSEETPSLLGEIQWLEVRYPLGTQESLRVIDAVGNSIDKIFDDPRVHFTVDIVNSQDREQPFTWLIMIQDSNGVAVSLVWIDGMLSAGQSFSPAMTWIPTDYGSYTITTFVWESIDNPTALSPPTSITIHVDNPMK